jgi:vacuolar protein sorting-associated protein 72
MSSSDSGSDSEPEFESIIATRARRSNAGSRLRQLLDLEETNTGLQPSTDADENVDLLFQEDEDDQEFIESENSETEGAEEGEENEEEKEETKSLRSTKTSEKRTKEGKQEDEEQGESDVSVNLDEMLSESDISVSETDEEEGERELEKQERLNKSRKRKANLPSGFQKKKLKSTSSVSKLPSTTKAVPKTHKPNMFDNAPISLSERRHSSRRATLESSIATHEKLEKEFEKKQSLVPVSKKEYIEKTLEERLEEAKITEKENVLSLTRFYEQEIQKKKKQRDLANSRKFKMRKFIRYWSTGIYITPLDEIDEIEEEKRKIQEEEEKKAKRKLQYLKRKQARLGIKNDTLQQVTASNEGSVKIENSEEISEIENKDTGEDKSEDISRIGDPQAPIDIGQSTDQVEKAVSKNVRFSEEITVSQDGISEELKASLKDAESNEVSNEISNEIINNEDGEDEEETTENTASKVVYEGPVRKVARTYLIFEEFDYDLTNDDAKKYLFGQQSLLAGPRRDPTCENVYIIKQDEASNIDLQKIQQAREESFKSLLKLPKFGEKITIDNYNDGKLTAEQDEVVKIHTPAPIGINLPNGQKKTCLTTGEPAVYYDPTNGVPYATVDAFRILKSLVDGEYEWLQLDNGGINSRYAGGIGCYIGKKNQRHAKGVPEGF